jgi:uncharacterized protein (TIGR02677 family)
MARWRYDAQPLLRYAAVQEAPMYREIMEVFAEEAAGYRSRLSPEDIYAALLGRLDPGDEDDDNDSFSLGEVKKRLVQLHDWGNLTQDFDSGRATSLESYEQTAYVYDLTPGGEAAAEALRALDDALRRVGGLQAVALRQIEEMLGQLAILLRAQRPDGDRIFGLCEDLHTRFKSLTTNAVLFMQKSHESLMSHSRLTERGQIRAKCARSCTSTPSIPSVQPNLAARQNRSWTGCSRHRCPSAASASQRCCGPRWRR